MKKFFILLFSLVCIVFIDVETVEANEYLKDFYAYEIQNVNIREFEISVKNVTQSYTGNDRYNFIEGVRNAYISNYSDITYFLRLYPANNNVNVFIVANENFNADKNEITDFLTREGYKFEKLKDKQAIAEYKSDFYILARQKKLGNFYITPDVTKPLKKGIAKLNDKLAKYNKKTAVIPYSVDSNPIKLTCVDITSYYDTESKISIIQKEYRLKEKSNKYVHAFEYILVNKNTSSASVSVTGEKLAGLIEVSNETFVDIDRIAVLDAVGTFPPILIGTAGLSLLCSVPNWIRWVKITKEATRYSHALPENYQLKPQGYLRILVLKYKENPKPLKFNLKFSDKEYNLSF